MNDSTIFSAGYFIGVADMQVNGNKSLELIFFKKPNKKGDLGLWFMFAVNAEWDNFLSTQKMGIEDKEELEQLDIRSLEELIDR